MPTSLKVSLICQAFIMQSKLFYSLHIVCRNEIEWITFRHFQRRKVYEEIAVRIFSSTRNRRNLFFSRSTWEYLPKYNIQTHLKYGNSLIHTHSHRVSEPIKLNEENFLNSILLQIVSNILNANRTVRFFLRRMQTQLFFCLCLSSKLIILIY